MSRKYAIFLDIDGTLLSSSGIPQENIDTIQQVRQRGHSVILNTGRAYGHIPDEVMEVPTDGAIAALGAYVRYRDKILRNITFSRKELRMITEYYLRTGEFCILEGPEESFYINPKGKEGINRITSPDDFEKKYPNGMVSIACGRGRMPDEAKKLFSSFFCLEHETYYEFTHKGSSKALGVKIILDHLGLKPEDAIAIGDSLNDLDMLEYAGISVAMGNAPEHIKEVCDYTTKTVEEAGVSEALKYLILGSDN
jgi:Cof subfamily protein (haloacid dehalogenase superfamily)